jgi:hypothetical protein
MSKRGPLDYIKDLTEKKTPWESLPETDKAGFQPYIINLFLCMNPDLLELVNDFQGYTITQMKPKNVYKLYLDILPKRRLPYNKYVKGNKTDKYNSDLVKLISYHFMISNRVAEEYIDFMPEVAIIDIIKLYGKTESEIKTLLKTK